MFLSIPTTCSCSCPVHCSESMAQFLLTEPIAPIAGINCLSLQKRICYSKTIIGVYTQFICSVVVANYTLRHLKSSQQSHQCYREKHDYFLLIQIQSICYEPSTRCETKIHPQWFLDWFTSLQCAMETRRDRYKARWIPTMNWWWWPSMLWDASMCM